MLKENAKQFVRQYVSPLLDLTGIHEQKLARLFDAENRLLILMYHRVIDDRAADPFAMGLCVRRHHFEQQIAWLAKTAHVLPLNDAVERLLNGDPLPRRAVAITFDDGYLDNLTIAAPILERYRMPATFYVVTGGIDEGRMLWWDQVIATLARATQKTVFPHALGLHELPVMLPLHAGTRRDTLLALVNAIWDRDQDSIEEILVRLRVMLLPVDDPVLAAPRMSVDQVRQLASRGFTIGGHTHTHIDPRLLSREQLQHELRISRALLQDITQQPVDSFAYPGGRSSVWMPDILAEEGYRHAVDTRRGINEAPASRYALGRVGMSDAPVGDFKRAIRNLAILRSTP